jgi:hypothetical protein
MDADQSRIENVPAKQAGALFHAVHAALYHAHIRMMRKPFFIFLNSPAPVFHIFSLKKYLMYFL